MRLRWSRQSREQLVAIRGYIRQHNLEAAERVRLRIVETVRQLGTLPRLGRAGRRLGHCVTSASCAILAQRACATDESCRAPGTLGEAQKQPGGLPPHSATLVQHSPPLCLLQQQSTSATFRPSMIDTSRVGRGTRHRALSKCLAQLASTFADEKVAKIDANATTTILAMERSRLVALYHPC